MSFLLLLFFLTFFWRHAKLKIFNAPFSCGFFSCFKRGVIMQWRRYVLSIDFISHDSFLMLFFTWHCSCEIFINFSTYTEILVLYRDCKKERIEGKCRAVYIDWWINCIYTTFDAWYYYLGWFWKIIGRKIAAVIFFGVITDRSAKSAIEFWLSVNHFCS